MTQRPVSSFAGRLMEILLKGAVESQKFYAEEDRRPPTLLPKGSVVADANVACVKHTRWHTVVFSSPVAAARFAHYIRIAQEMHLLRKAMQREGHEKTDDAYKARVSVDDRLGALVIEPRNQDIEDILAASGKNAAATQSIEQPLLMEDPLAKL